MPTENTAGTERIMHTPREMRVYEQEHTARSDHRYWYLETGAGFVREAKGGFGLSGIIREVDARRLAACWNALSLLSTTGIERLARAPEQVEAALLREDLRMMRVAELEAALAPLVTIADAYDENALDDEARKFWSDHNDEHENTMPPAMIELYSGRGGRQLLTLAHCLEARRALAPAVPFTNAKEGE